MQVGKFDLCALYVRHGDDDSSDVFMRYEVFGQSGINDYVATFPDMRIRPWVT